MQSKTLLQPTTSGTGDTQGELQTKGLTKGQLDYIKMIEKFPSLALLGAVENCQHETIPAQGGGVKCKYCSGWFCF